MIKFKPEKLSRSRIQELAEEFRSSYKFAQKLPVMVEDLIELELGLEIVLDYGLKQKAGVEAFLSANLKQIRVDNNEYETNNLSNRYRFTLAEEIGHFYLHKDIYNEGVKYESVEEFIDDYAKMDEDDLGWIEFQAREFAGRLLVPKDILKQKIEEKGDEIARFHQKYEGTNESMDLLKEGISKITCNYFGVSWHVIHARIRIENLEYLLKP